MSGGKKNLVVAFMLAAAAVVSLSGCTQQETETTLDVAETTVKAAKVANAVRSKIMEEVADAADNAMDNGPPSQIRAEDVPKYLSKEISSRSSPASMLKYACSESGFSDGMFSLPHDDAWKDGKCLGYLQGKTSGDVTYGDADVYAWKGEKVVRIYKEPTMRKTVKAFGDLIDATLGMIGESIDDMQEDNKRRRRYSYDYD